MRWLKVIVAMAVCGIGAAARADVKLPAILGNNMAFQADKPLPVWGKADPGEKVTVQFAGQSAEAQAEADGRWKVVLKPAAASAKPATMTISGKNTITLTNIVVGEVWLCSGQSNMAYRGNDVTDADKEVPAANWPLIRMFHVKMMPGQSDDVRDDVVGEWRECSPIVMKDFSAVGYFFGREIYKRLQMPVGLINSSRGGTPIEAWTRLERMKSDPKLKEVVEQFEKRKDAQAEERAYRALLANWEKRVQQAKAAGRPEPPKPEKVDSSTAPGRPGNLWNAMIAPLVPYAIRGVIWYQGETNVNRSERYAHHFPAMIEDWRTQWGEGDFPFVFVQLPNYGPRANEPSDHPWARQREAQLKTLAVANTSMAVTVDVGDDKLIHPPNKLDVGLRLAMAALHDVYGQQDIVPSGPIFDRMQIDGDNVRLFFKHIGGGLVSRSGEILKGFALAGADKQFVWADARIDGDTVVVSAAAVKQPVAVRYAWAASPQVSLYNKAGLPACPFRTDDWPLNVSKPAR